MLERRIEPLACSLRERFSVHERPGQVRELGSQPEDLDDTLQDHEVLSILRDHVDVDAVMRQEGTLSQRALIDAFRDGFRTRRLSAGADATAAMRWRAVREGHHLERASWRAGSWVYDEVFPDHLLTGSRVEVYGFRAEVRRVRLGLPDGISASRQAQDGRYAFVIFEPAGSDPLALFGDTPRSEWVPFSEVRVLERATAPEHGDGCRRCGAEPCSVLETLELTLRHQPGLGTERCGCCGAPWMGGRVCSA